MNKKPTNSASAKPQSFPFEEAQVTAGAVKMPPHTTTAIRTAAEVYLAVKGHLREEDEELDGEDLVNRVSVDLAACAFLEGRAGVRGRNVAVSHWAVFADQVDAGAFCSSLQFYGYEVFDLRATGVRNEVVVHFSHLDTFGYDNLCQRTVFLFRQALASGGAYAGWQVKYGAFSVGTRDPRLLGHIAANAATQY